MVKLPVIVPSTSIELKLNANGLLADSLINIYPNVERVNTKKNHSEFIFIFSVC